MAEHTQPPSVTPSYDPRLTNDDLAPLKDQRWTWYNVFAFWMSDVHSVGGYVTAGSLFALGLASWQVFICLIVGIVIVQVLANLVARPSQISGTPFPVIVRSAFGVRGANIPAIIRGLIAVAWYGIQTFLASEALLIIVLRLWPASAEWADKDLHSFLGLSPLGWAAYLVLWVAQAFVFWHGMDSIRKFIDWAGPAVYVVMIALAIYLVAKAGWSNINLTLGDVKYTGAAALPVMLSAIALVVSYFSGPLLNYGDISRYARTTKDVERGNLLGLPVNFTLFSLLTVLCAAATVPVYGELLTDPIETVSRIDSTWAILLGALTFTVATIGINIVANFISPAFDFAHVDPQRISWRTGGMIAAVGSVLITPWNLYSSPTLIHYTLDTLASFTGPLFGILVASYYIVHRRVVRVHDLYTMSEKGAYWYKGGFNPAAIWATIIGGGVALTTVLIPALHAAANYAWFTGCAVGTIAFLLLSRGAAVPEPEDSALAAEAIPATSLPGASHANMEA